MIDWHTHIASDSLRPPPGAVGDWPAVAKVGPTPQLMLGDRVYRDVDSRSYDPAARLPGLAGLGVSRQVLSPVPYIAAFRGPPDELVQLAGQQNRFTAQAVESAMDQFLMFGMLPVGAHEAAVTDTLAEVIAIERMPGVVGIMLIAGLHDELVAESSRARWRGIWERIAANGWLVLVHPDAGTLDSCDATSGSPFGFGMPTATGRFGARLVASGLLSEVPGLRFLLSHAGGSLPACLDRIDFGWRVSGGVGPASPLELARRCLWVDSVAYSAAPIHIAQEVLGPDRVVYGSDYPFAGQVDLAVLHQQDPRLVPALLSAGERLARDVARTGV